MNKINWIVTVDKQNYKTYLELDKRCCSDACLQAKDWGKLKAYVDDIFHMLTRLYVCARFYLQNDYKFQMSQSKSTSPIDLRIVTVLIQLRIVTELIQRKEQDGYRIIRHKLNDSKKEILDMFPKWKTIHDSLEKITFRGNVADDKELERFTELSFKDLEVDDKMEKDIFFAELLEDDLKEQVEKLSFMQYPRDMLDMLVNPE
jgi:hypothetical protein